MDILFIFLTGLTTGGLSCLAMQGGLLTSVIANQKEQEHDSTKLGQSQAKGAHALYSQKSVIGNFLLPRLFASQDFLPVAMFLVSKLIAHTVLGFFLGWLGSTISLSLGVRLSFQIFTALFMLATAMNLLNIHPIFRYLAFQPPAFIRKMIRHSSKSSAVFAPAVLGVVTIFIPCGVTQAMEVLAINSAHPIQGALIMFFFTLGTFPLFALLGLATAKLTQQWYTQFTRIVGVLLIALAVYSLNGVLVVLDSPLSINNMVEKLKTAVASPSEPNSSQPRAVVRDGVQYVTISVLNRGYSPQYFQVQRNVPLQLTVESNATYSCALAFVFKEFGINTFLESTDSQTFTFTPQKPGKYTYTCSMGMYTGIMEVL